MVGSLALVAAAAAGSAAAGSAAASHREDPWDPPGVSMAVISWREANTFAALPASARNPGVSDERDPAGSDPTGSDPAGSDPTAPAAVSAAPAHPAQNAPTAAGGGGSEETHAPPARLGLSASGKMQQVPGSGSQDPMSYLDPSGQNKQLRPPAQDLDAAIQQTASSTFSLLRLFGYGK